MQRISLWCFLLLFVFPAASGALDQKIIDEVGPYRAELRAAIGDWLDGESERALDRLLVLDREHRLHSKMWQVVLVPVEGEVAEGEEPEMREVGKRVETEEVWRGFVQELGEKRPEAWIAFAGLLAVLHDHELWTALREREAELLEIAYETRERYELLVKLARDLGTPAVRRAIGRTSSRIATTLRDAGRLDGAIVFYEKALDTDPREPAILHALAAIEERLGLHHQAAKTLKRVVELEPDNAEARLRYALTQKRRSRERRARRLLEEITNGEGPAWVRALAYQEWAQLHALEGKRREALQVVRRGRAELPDDPALETLELYLSGEMPPALNANAEPSEEAPRMRYNDWPADLEPVLEELEAEAEKYREELAQALDELERQ